MEATLREHELLARGAKSHLLSDSDPMRMHGSHRAILRQACKWSPSTSSTVARTHSTQCLQYVSSSLMIYDTAGRLQEFIAHVVPGKWERDVRVRSTSKVHGAAANQQHAAAAAAAAIVYLLLAHPYRVD